MGKRNGPTRHEVPRQNERFLTSALSCPVGSVVDVSRDGFRLSSPKRMAVKAGEVHEVVLRAGAQQVRVSARVQWARRTGIWPVRYEAGFRIVDQRAGVGSAVLQLGQFGCIGSSGDSADAGSASEAKGQPMPRVEASVEIEDLYAILGVADDVSASDLKSAYRKLAQRHHPDHSSEADAAEVFDRIAKAWAVLGDARRREWYDKIRRGEIAA